jgi:hypothetical protein
MQQQIERAGELLQLDDEAGLITHHGTAHDRIHGGIPPGSLSGKTRRNAPVSS